LFDRRTFLRGLSLLPFLRTPELSLLAQDYASASAEDPTRFVNIFIGTGGHGHTYPGATVPFGMVQLSPDTFNDGWDWCSGYHYSDASIMGFSHTHLSGTGAADMLDFLLMPGTGPTKLVPGSRDNPGEGYRSRFSHAEETATPGYYSVLLRDYNIRAELTATERVGVHKYTFPASDSSHFILDLAHVIGIDPKVIEWAELKVTGPDTIVGGRSINGWATGRELYFAMKFSKPFASVELFSDDKKVNGRESRGKVLKLLVHYQTSAGEPIFVKTGLSGVSMEGALKNLDVEVPGWDFDGIRRKAHESWRQTLSRIRIETKDAHHREIFYTSLYHTMVAPTLFDDVDGQYRGMDGKVHQLSKGTHNYSTFSLWDTFRAAHPLYTLALADRVPDFVNCLIRMCEESPAGPPVWPLQAKETGTMTGYHSASVIAEAYVKGFTGIDFAKCYPAMRRRAMDDDYRGMPYYRKLGYIPCDKEEESCSKQIEYSYNDWAVAQIARAAGAAADEKLLLQRSRNYRNLFDKNVAFIRPKLENGEWSEPFTPTEMGHSKQWRDYTESDPWQTTFTVQHDVGGYMELFGGREAFVAKLDRLFTENSQLPPDAPPDIAGMVGQYAHGNEPCHHMAYLYCYAGVPHKTQALVRRLLEFEYDNQPTGLAGNEDCGQMSAWYVMSALGFYAVDPVSGNYVFGSPLFDRAEVQLRDNATLRIEVKRTSPGDVYIQSVTLNGKTRDKIWFQHAEIGSGGTLVFQLGSEPSATFGKSESELPPPLP